MLFRSGHNALRAFAVPVVFLYTIAAWAQSLASLPLAPDAKVLRTSTFTATSNGSGSNLFVPGSGTLTIDFAVAPGSQVQFAVLTGEQYEQALRGQKVTGGPLMQAQVTGSGSRSVALNRGTYFVYFAALNAAQATLSYRASYRLQ